MRIVGLDLAVTGTHKGVVMTDRGEYVQCAAPPQSREHAWSEALAQLAAKVVCVYGESGRYLDFDSLEAEIISKQGFLETVEAEKRRLRQEVIRPLYRKLHPERHLESLLGVGEDSAAIYLSFIGDPHRLPTPAPFADGVAWCLAAVRAVPARAKAYTSARLAPI